MIENRQTSATGALFAIEEDGGDGDGAGADGARTISSLTCECRMIIRVDEQRGGSERRKECFQAPFFHGGG